MSASKYFSSPELRAPLPGTPERQAAAGGKDDRHDPVSPRAGGGESQPAPESIGSQSSYMTRSQPGHTHNAPAKRRQNTTSLALAELDGSMARSQPVHNASAKLGQAMHHSALGDEGQPESNGSPSGRTSQLTKKRWQSTKSLVLAKLDIRSVTALVQQFNDHIEHGDQGVVASTRVRQAMLEQSGEAFGGIGFSSWLMPAAVAWQIWGCECAVIRTPVSNSNSCCGCLLTRSLARPPARPPAHRLLRHLSIYRRVRWPAELRRRRGLPARRNCGAAGQQQDVPAERGARPVPVRSAGGLRGLPGPEWAVVGIPAAPAGGE